MQPNPSPRQIEESSLNAWPGVTQSLYDGWVVRFSDGYTKRANCAVPFYAGALKPESKVAWCEGAYRRRGLPAIFKILPFAEPADLDERLSRRGYELQDRTMVMCRDLAGLPTEEARGARIRDVADEQYLREYARLNLIPHADLPRIRDILSRTAGDVAYAAIARQDHTVACGLGILEGHHLGLYGIATDPDWRRHGLGSSLVRSLLAWGSVAGARLAYLQVRAVNTAARAMYDSWGFSLSYEYWYRVQPSA